jgi:hypothetical protein
MTVEERLAVVERRLARSRGVLLAVVLAVPTVFLVTAAADLKLADLVANSVTIRNPDGKSVTELSPDGSTNVGKDLTVGGKLTVGGTDVAARLAAAESRLLAIDGYLRQVAEKGIVGTVERRNKNVVYTAETDGFVTVYQGGSSPPQFDVYVDGYLLGRSQAGYHSAMVPVKKGQKWEVRTIDDRNPNDAPGKHEYAGAYPFWIPIQVPALPK